METQRKESHRQRGETEQGSRNTERRQGTDRGDRQKEKRHSTAEDRFRKEREFRPAASSPHMSPLEGRAHAQKAATESPFSSIFLSKWTSCKNATVQRGLHLLTLPTEDEVLAEGTLFCREYIARRLRAGELLPPNLEHAAAPWGDTYPGKESNRAKCLLQTGAARCGAVNSELQAAGEHLDAMYPDLYDSLTGQLEMTLRSEDEAHNTLLAVSRHLYKRQVTWGKVVAGLALTAALAADCVRQGHPEYVKDVVEAFIKVMQRHTAPWIVKQGGWADVIQVCRGSSGTPIFWAFSLIGATIGFSLTILLIGNV